MKTHRNVGELDHAFIATEMTAVARRQVERQERLQRLQQNSGTKDAKYLQAGGKQRSEHEDDDDEDDDDDDDDDEGGGISFAPPRAVGISSARGISSAVGVGGGSSGRRDEEEEFNGSDKGGMEGIEMVRIPVAKAGRAHLGALQGGMEFFCHCSVCRGAKSFVHGTNGVGARASVCTLCQGVC